MALMDGICRRSPALWGRSRQSVLVDVSGGQTCEVVSAVKTILDSSESADPRIWWIGADFPGEVIRRLHTAER